MGLVDNKLGPQQTQKEEKEEEEEEEEEEENKSHTAVCKICMSCIFCASYTGEAWVVDCDGEYILLVFLVGDFLLMFLYFCFAWRRDPTGGYSVRFLRGLRPDS
eukprot:14726393-Ditylum_brightwellii.AAC.1